MSIYFDEFDDVIEEDVFEKDYQKVDNSKKYELRITDWLNSINYNKNNLMNNNNEKKYPQYMINNILSKNKETIAYVDCLNMLDISNKCHYDFLLEALPSKKRYSQFFNKKVKITEDLELVKKYYNVSYNRASMYLKQLNEQDLEELRLYFNEGGSAKKR